MLYLIELFCLNQALNELETSDDCDENKPDCSVYNVIQRYHCSYANNRLFLVKLLLLYFIMFFLFFCRANIRKMKSKATGKVIGKQTVCPKSHQTGRAGVPVTPCAAARAPDQAGRTNRTGYCSFLSHHPREKKLSGHLLFSSQCHSGCPAGQTLTEPD